MANDRDEVERIVVGIDRGSRDQTALSIGHPNPDGTYTILSVLHGADAEAVLLIAAERDALREKLEAVVVENERLRQTHHQLEQQWAAVCQIAAMELRDEADRAALRDAQGGADVE